MTLTWTDVDESWQVYAIASLALGPSNYDTAESYYYMALNHQEFVLELDSLESIQSLLSCAVYSIRSPTGGSLWYDYPGEKLMNHHD